MTSGKTGHDKSNADELVNGTSNDKYTITKSSVKITDGKGDDTYTIKKLDNIYDCGFPITSINKIEAKIEELKINYLVVNKADNYEVYEEQDFKTENKYIQIYNKAHKYINRKNRITEIYNYLMENINCENIKEKINEVEEILYEG